MRSRHIASLVGLALATACAGVSGGSKAQETPGVTWQRSDVYGPQEYIPLTGTCSMDVSPDQAVIVGGVSSAGLKPTDASDQLDKQLALMKAYIAEKHGQIEMLERVRTLKSPQPGRTDNEPPFRVIQRLQVTLPADAPVDTILDKLIELGFDRFGDNVLNDYNRREAVVRYRVSDIERKLKDLQQQCTVEAWKQWCNSSSVNGNCDSQTPPSDLALQQFIVRSSETLMRPDGNSAPWQFVVTRSQRANPPPDLLGNVTVHLEGNITFTNQRVTPKS